MKLESPYFVRTSSYEATASFSGVCRGDILCSSEWGYFGGFFLLVFFFGFFWGGGGVTFITQPPQNPVIRGRRLEYDVHIDVYPMTINDHEVLIERKAIPSKENLCK